MLRCSRSEVESTLSALERAGVDPAEVSYLVFTSASDLHLKYKLGPTLLDWAGVPRSEWLRLPVSFYRSTNVRMVQTTIGDFVKGMGATVEFGSEDGSRADLGYLAILNGEAVAAGAQRIILADTVGCFSPSGVRAATNALREAVPAVPLVVHFHNDLGLAAWNTVCGLGAGATFATTSVNGIGERAGNASLHQVVLQLRYVFGIELPRFRYDQLRPLARYTEIATGIPVQPIEPGIGLNVFTHESGIHAAGTLVHPATYQHIPPDDLGCSVNYIFGKHSGVAVVENVLRQHSVSFDDELIAAVVREVKRIREERADSADYAPFLAQYYAHLSGLGLGVADVLDIASGLQSHGATSSR
jgi:isopropylmalate/homocitrate/citramalate synthase